MDAVEITIERRADTGKESVGRLRRRGIVPAVFYGPKRTTVTINVDAAEFENKLLHLEGSHLIRLIHGGGDAELHDKMALLREKQVHLTPWELGKDLFGREGSGAGNRSSKERIREVIEDRVRAENHR